VVQKRAARLKPPLRLTIYTMIERNSSFSCSREPLNEPMQTRSLLPDCRITQWDSDLEVSVTLLFASLLEALSDRAAIVVRDHLRTALNNKSLADVTMVLYCTRLWPMLRTETHRHIGRQSPPRANHRNFDCKKRRLRLIVCSRITVDAQVIDAKSLILDSVTLSGRVTGVSAGGHPVLRPADNECPRRRS
jgi:hypothetical protein